MQINFQMRSKAVLLHFIFQYLNWKWSQFYSRINYIIKNNYRRECAGFLQVRPWMQWDDHGWFSSSGLGLFGHHWVADTYLRGVPPIPIEPRSPALQVDSLPAKPQGKPFKPVLFWFQRQIFNSAFSHFSMSNSFSKYRFIFNVQFIDSFLTV